MEVEGADGHVVLCRARAAQWVLDEQCDAPRARSHIWLAGGERAQPTAELLWPNTPFVDRFTLAVSRHAFDGWAKQPSPCCAAASVAGACNAVLGLGHPSQQQVQSAASDDASPLSNERLRDLARERPAALLCFEADHAGCHRSVLAERLAREDGFEVVNL